MSDLAAELAKAVAKRDRKMTDCPVNNVSFYGGRCTRCGSTTSGPCWVMVNADSDFLDDARALLATIPAASQPNPPADGTPHAASEARGGQDTPA